MLRCSALAVVSVAFVHINRVVLDLTYGCAFELTSPVCRVVPSMDSESRVSAAVADRCGARRAFRSCRCLQHEQNPSLL